MSKKQKPQNPPSTDPTDLTEDQATEETTSSQEANLVSPKRRKPVKPTVGRFKLLVGMHSEGGKVYNQGDIIDSASDLLKHNKPGMSPKFASADDVVHTTPGVDEDGYDQMTVEELRQWAEEGDINVEGLNSKEKIVAAIRAAEQELA